MTEIEALEARKQQLEEDVQDLWMLSEVMSATLQDTMELTPGCSQRRSPGRPRNVGRADLLEAGSESWITVSKACRLVEWSRSTLYRRLSETDANGTPRIQAKKDGGRTKISPPSLVAYMEAQPDFIGRSSR